jgi:hypothetical protein
MRNWIISNGISNGEIERSWLQEIPNEESYSNATPFYTGLEIFRLGWSD